MNDCIFQISYSSIGKGGGTGLSGNTDNYDENGQYNLQDAYDLNSTKIDALYSPNETQSTTYLRSSINNRYGALSTVNYLLTDKTTLSGGLDMRYYRRTL